MQPYEVFAIRCGTVTEARRRLLVDDEARDPEQELRMDFFFWLLRNDSRSLLVDTGFTATAAARRGRTMVREPAAGLRELQGDAEVDALLLTHLHYDHIGNLGLVRTAPVYVGRREFEYRSGEAETADRGMVDRDDLSRLEAAAEEGRLRLIGEREEIVPGVVAERVGGHTPGQLVVEVAAVGGLLVLASDALHFYEELDDSAVFAHTVDVAEARRATRRLAELAAAGATIVPGHDPRVCERFPALDGGSIFNCTERAPNALGGGREN